MAKTSSNSSITIIEEKNAVIVTGILSQNVDKSSIHNLRDKKSKCKDTKKIVN